MSNVLRVGQADIQRKLTLGGGDQLGVLEADLDGYPVLGLVAEALAGVVGPGPGGRGLDGVEGQQTLVEVNHPPDRAALSDGISVPAHASRMAMPALVRLPGPSV